MLSNACLRILNVQKRFTMHICVFLNVNPIVIFSQKNVGIMVQNQNVAKRLCIYVDGAVVRDGTMIIKRFGVS